MRFHDELIEAINYSRELQIFYDGSLCRIEPHTYGINYVDHFVLRAFQIGYGGSDSGPFCWKNFVTTEISHLRETGVAFSRPRPGYILEATPMKRIFARLPRRRNSFTTTGPEPEHGSEYIHSPDTEAQTIQATSDQISARPTKGAREPGSRG